MMISSRSSAAVSGSLRMPKSSMVSSGVVVRDSMNCLRVPAVGDRLGQIVQQHVRLTVQHAVALLDGGWPYGLCQRRFARSAVPEKQGVFPFAEEGAGGQVEDQATIHLRIEGEVEVVQGLVRVAEGGLF